MVAKSVRGMIFETIFGLLLLPSSNATLFTNLKITSWAALPRSPVPGFIDLPSNTISASRTHGIP